MYQYDLGENQQTLGIKAFVHDNRLHIVTISGQYTISLIDGK